jgi:outer membrane protein OmpA-like peptidoglycan-associated protein
MKHNAAAAGSHSMRATFALPSLLLAFLASAAFGQGAPQPNLSAVKSDFVPGEKTIFFDDFSDMQGGEPPPHWKVRGGTAELRLGGDIRQLTLVEPSMELAANLKGLPKNFTMEVEFQFDNVSENGLSATWVFLTKDGKEAMSVKTFVQDDSSGEHPCIIDIVTNPWQDNQEDVGTAKPKVDIRKPIAEGLWVQDGRVRLYVNGNRYIDANQIDVAAIASVELRLDMSNSPGGSTGLRQVRFAESAPDVTKTIMSSGRYVTHGILFDTDSDRIRPESAPVLRTVAAALKADPSLKLLIEGHTDSSGQAAHNMDLSKRRAEAVKAVLVSQFGIEAARLTTAGLGATKPISTNDTPQGRADNRRVEFVKQ